MDQAKIIVLYPHPTDTAAFDRLYEKEHRPMALKNFAGLTKFLATKVAGAVQGKSPFYLMAELYFPSMEALKAAAGSELGQKAVAHGMSISTGGPMVILIAEEQTHMP